MQVFLGMLNSSKLITALHCLISCTSSIGSVSLETAGISATLLISAGSTQYPSPNPHSYLGLGQHIFPLSHPQIPQEAVFISPLSQYKGLCSSFPVTSATQIPSATNALL